MRTAAARQLGAIMVCTVCVAAQLSAILPLLPIAVRDVTGSTARSGVVTGALALGTVVVELHTPRLLDHWSARAALATGFLAVGSALFGLSLVPPFPVMIGLGLLFGMGFGLNVTVGSTVVGSIGDARRRRGALTLYSTATSVPMIIAPPVALLALPHFHLRGLFDAGAVIAAVGLLAAIAAPRRDAGSAEPARLRTTMANRRVMILFAAFTCVTFTYGGVVSLSSFVIDGRGLGSVAAFFLVFGIFRAIGRSGSAAALRAVPAGRLFVPSVACSALGLGCLAVGNLTFDLVAAVIFGASFGTLQTASFVAMLDHKELAAAAPVVALWNVAIDAGTGLGALALAPLAVVLGYRPTFLVMSGVALTAAGLHLADSHTKRKSAGTPIAYPPGRP